MCLVDLLVQIHFEFIFEIIKIAYLSGLLTYRKFNSLAGFCVTMEYNSFFLLKNLKIDFENLKI